MLTQYNDYRDKQAKAAAKDDTQFINETYYSIDQVQMMTDHASRESIRPLESHMALIFNSLPIFPFIVQ
jgi:hypothetical protein